MLSSKTNRIRILFIAEASTLAHIVRPLTLANSLNPEEFEILFASDKHFDWAFEGTDLQRIPIHSRSPETVLTVANSGGILFDQDILAEYLAADLKLISEVRPALIVGDMRQSLAISAPLSQVPLVTLTNAHWSPFAKRARFPHPPLPALSFFAGAPKLSCAISSILTRTFQLALPKVLTQQASGLAALRRKYNLPAFPDYFSGFTFGDQTLFCDTPLLAPTIELAHNQAYIGPINWSPKVPLPQWWLRIPKDKPKAYVCLGSSGNFNVTEKIVAALVENQVIPIVAGSGFDALRPWPGCFGAKMLPGAAVCEQVDFVISNGGSPTSYQALAAGKPVLGIPSNMDQILTMHRIAELKAGIMLRPEQISANSLNAAIRSLKTTPIFSTNAKIIKNEISTYSPAAKFRLALDKLLNTNDQAMVAR